MVVMVPNWERLNEVYKAAQRVGVNFDLHYFAPNDSWRFSIRYPGEQKRLWYGEQTKYNTAIKLVLDNIRKLPAKF